MICVCACSCVHACVCSFSPSGIAGLYVRVWSGSRPNSAFTVRRVSFVRQFLVGYFSMMCDAALGVRMVPTDACMLSVFSVNYRP